MECVSKIGKEIKPGKWKLFNRGDKLVAGWLDDVVAGDMQVEPQGRQDAKGIAFSLRVDNCRAPR